MNNMGAIIIVRNIPAVAIVPIVPIVPIVVPSDEDIKRVKTETNGRLAGNEFTKFLYL